MECKKQALTFVTGNKGKLLEVQAILGKYVPSLVNQAVDLPELQGEPEDICREKCRLAAQAIQGPCLVEDTSLCFNALHGLPGPYVKWFLQKTGHEGLNNLLKAYPDKTAYSQTIFGLSLSPEQEPLLFTGQCHGTIVTARGPNSFSTSTWDPIFQPGGQALTFAEMEAEQKNSMSHRYRALMLLKDYLEENPSALDAESKRQKLAAS